MSKVGGIHEEGSLCNLLIVPVLALAAKPNAAPLLATG